MEPAFRFTVKIVIATNCNICEKTRCGRYKTSKSKVGCPVLVNLQQRIERSSILGVWHSGISNAIREEIHSVTNCNMSARFPLDTKNFISPRVLTIIRIREMACSDRECAIANAVRKGADGLDPVGREVRDLAILLRIASVSVKHNAGNLVLNGR